MGALALAASLFLCSLFPGGTASAASASSWFSSSMGDEAADVPDDGRADAPREVFLLETLAFREHVIPLRAIADELVRELPRICLLRDRAGRWR